MLTKWWKRRFKDAAKAKKKPGGGVGFLPAGLLETEYADEEVSVRSIVISDAQPLKRKLKWRESWGNYRRSVYKLSRSQDGLQERLVARAVSFAKENDRG